MHPFHELLLQWTCRMAGPRVLDFGCGAGELVEEGRARGIDVVGAEVFHGDGSDRETVRAAGHLGTWILEIENGRVPLPDGSIDVIVSNQVIEHVHDLDGLVREWWRLLRPGGVAYAIFPLRQSWREPHVGVPLVHRMPAGRAREAVTAGAYRLGLGHYRDDRPAPVWVRESLDWVDAYTVYRSAAQVEAAFGGSFSLDWVDDEALLAVLPERARRPAAVVARTAAGRRSLVAVGRRLGVAAFEARRLDG